MLMELFCISEAIALSYDTREISNEGGDIIMGITHYQWLRFMEEI